MMRYVILRDDDTNALTPVSCLDQLYRPFFDRHLPVCLAAIPNVRTDITYGQNILEGFLGYRNGTTEKMLPLSENKELVGYILDHPEFEIAQHGYSHEFIRGDCEFEQQARADIARRLENGTELLIKAGFPRPQTFVAPYDRFTRVSLKEVSKRFRVISASWFELGRLPYGWWPRYALHKASRLQHWRAGGTILLSHPRCYLSFRRPYASMLDEIKQSIASRKLTVLVTHWWEFFPDNQPDEAFIRILHQLAEYLAEGKEAQMVSFRDVAEGKVPLH